MADKYCDHGAYGAYAAVPTWGSAQDGDGTAKTIGTPATASVVFTGVPSSGVIAVLGQTITFTRVTSADVCANNLATAINASTAVATGPASFTQLSQVRNHLYARGPANGAPAGTCQIMTRQASADHAGLICATHTLNNVSSPATINFAGGSGGCWGWLANIGSIWASAIAEAAYGVLVGGGPYTGRMDPGDFVKVRSGKTLTFTTGGSNLAINLPQVGAPDNPVVIDIDDSTEWADGANPVLTLERTTTGNTSTYSFGSANSNTYIHLRAKKYASGERSFKFLGSMTGTSRVLVNHAAATRIENVEVSLVTTLGGLSLGPTGANTEFPVYKDCVFSYHGLSALFQGSGTTAAQRAVWQGCDFVATAAFSAVNLAAAGFVSSSSPRKFLFDACRFIGFVPGSGFFPSNSIVGSASHVVAFRNCSLGGVIVGPSFMGSTGVTQAEGDRGVYASSQLGTRDFSYEDAGMLFVEWRAAADRPTLNAKLRDGITPWSMYAVASNVSGRVTRLTPVTLPRISKILPPASDMPEAPRTITLNFLMDSTVSWTKADVSVLFEYVGADGTLRTVDTYDPAAGALDVSTAAWSATSWNGQTWVKRAITFTTPVAVQADSEVAFFVRLHNSVVNDTLGIILDPETVVT